MLPNLIVIGGQKCGTTSLHFYLAAHPQISMSATKELDFFASWGWRRGLAWYESQFPEPARVRGESSPSYTAFPHVPGVSERMRRTLPEVKLIYLVRDPVERMISEYLHAYGRGAETRPLAAVFSDPGFEDSAYVAKSRYAMQLERYLELFDPRDILVLEQRRLSADRRGALREAFAFLGVEESFSPRFARRYNRAHDERRSRRALESARATLTPERFDALSARTPARLRRLADRSLWRPVPRPPLAPALRDRLVSLVARDTARLRELTGLALTDWST